MGRYKRENVNMSEFADKLVEVQTIAQKVGYAARGQQGMAFPDDLDVEVLAEHIRWCLYVAREVSDVAVLLSNLESRMRNAILIDALAKREAAKPGD